MDYYKELQYYKLINLSTQLTTPTLLRVDINLPASDGIIAQDALRIRVYAHVVEMYASYAGLVIMSHQGRKGGKDFTSLKPHWRLLMKMLPDDIDVEFIPYTKVFSSETKEKIKNLEPKRIILLDNVRYFDHEKEFNEFTSPYISFFKDLIKVCINDSMPTWHRNDSSLMCLPYITDTYIGMRSSYELKILDEVINTNEPKALVSGGAKLQKVSDLVKIRKTTEIYTGGLPGQLIARVKGYSLGELNNEFLARKFNEKDVEGARKLASQGVGHPIDFTVLENGEDRNVSLADMTKSKGIIKDIGEATLDYYAEKLQKKQIRIRAGPLGVYEEGYQNGLELTKRIAGEGLIFLGGDTSQEVVDTGLLGHIEDSGGRICISGGSFLAGMAENPFPSIDLLLRLYKLNR